MAIVTPPATPAHERPALGAYRRPATEESRRRLVWPTTPALGAYRTFAESPPERSDRWALRWPWSRPWELDDDGPTRATVEALEDELASERCHRAAIERALAVAFPERLKPRSEGESRNFSIGALSKKSPAKPPVTCGVTRLLRCDRTGRRLLVRLPCGEKGCERCGPIWRQDRARHWAAVIATHGERWGAMELPTEDRRARDNLRAQLKAQGLAAIVVSDPTRPEELALFPLPKGAKTPCLRAYPTRTVAELEVAEAAELVATTIAGLTAKGRVDGPDDWSVAQAKREAQAAGDVAPSWSVEWDFAAPNLHPDQVVTLAAELRLIERRHGPEDGPLPCGAGAGWWLRDDIAEHTWRRFLQRAGAVAPEDVWEVRRRRRVA